MHSSKCSRAEIRDFEFRCYTETILLSCKVSFRQIARVGFKLAATRNSVPLTFAQEYRQKGSIPLPELLMKKVFFPALVLVSLAIPIAVCAQQPPIIDRQLFFGEVQIAGAQISPDGQYLSFLKPYKAREISGSRKRLIRSVRRAR